MYVISNEFSRNFQFINSYWWIQYIYPDSFQFINCTKYPSIKQYFTRKILNWYRLIINKQCIHLFWFIRYIYHHITNFHKSANGYLINVKSVREIGLISSHEDRERKIIEIIFIIAGEMQRRTLKSHRIPRSWYGQNL